MTDPADQSSSTPSSGIARTGDPLARLRGFRVYPDRVRTVADDVQRAMHSLRMVSQTEQAAIEAWNTVVPDHLGEQAQAVGMDRGKLIVTIPSAAMRYKVENWLRSGGLRGLQSLARVPIRSVQMKIVAQHADPEAGTTRIEK